MAKFGERKRNYSRSVVRLKPKREGIGAAWSDAASKDEALDNAIAVTSIRNIDHQYTNIYSAHHFATWSLNVQKHP